MRKSILIVLAISAIFTASAQIDAKPTSEVSKTVFSCGSFKIVQIDKSYAFYYWDATYQTPQYFLMDNKQSAQDLINLMLKMFKNQNLSDSYSFTKPGFSYQLSWFQDKVVLYIIPDIGRGNMWMLNSKDIAAINL